MVRAQPHAVAYCALRVHVYEERFHTAPSERGGEIHCGGRLTDTAFLAHDGEDGSHSLFRAGDGVRPAACLDLLDGLPGMLDPPFRFDRGRRMLQKGRQVALGALAVAALEQQIRQAIVRAAQLRVDFECPAIAADGVVQSSGSRIRDRHVLEDALIVGLIAQCEPVRRERGVVVTLALQRQRFAQVVETLWARRVRRSTTRQAAPPGHAMRLESRTWVGRRTTVARCRNAHSAYLSRANLCRPTRGGNRAVGRERATVAFALSRTRPPIWRTRGATT